MVHVVKSSIYSHNIIIMCMHSCIAYHLAFITNTTCTPLLSSLDVCLIAALLSAHGKCIPGLEYSGGDVD